MPRPLFLPARRRPAPAAEPDQRKLARRAQLDRPLRNRRWLRVGVAVLAVSVLGVGTASSVVLTGRAERPLTVTPTAPKVEVSIAPGVKQPSAFARGAESAARPNAGSTTATPERASRNASRPPVSRRPSTATVAQARAKSLRDQAAATAAAAKKRADKLAKKKAAERAAERSRHKALLGNGHPVLPVAGGRTAAGFGATGAWARYHTGIDYSAGSGTKVRAPRAGKVTNAGSGSASGWAGTYVTIKHSDGTSSLYAHLSSTEVSDGQRVNAGEVVGRVGQTGRAFGPHLHFEIYPAGVTPGDVYEAVNPRPWLHDLGLD